MKLLEEKIIDTREIRVTPRPVWKCRTCEFYGKRPSCPPYVPSWKEARELVSNYTRALLLKFEIDMEHFEEEKRKFLLYLLEKEKEMFREYSYVLSLFPGACNLCEECTYETEGVCKMPTKVRPSIDAIGIEMSSIVKLNYHEPVLYGLILLD